MSRSGASHNKVHWRRIRNMLDLLVPLEGVNKSQYNFNNICCYSCMGIELQGKNVKYQTNNGLACFVDNNSYTVFEIPSVRNTYPSYGEFLFLSYDTDFNYWVFGESTVRLNTRKTKGITSTYETVYFIPYGAYTFGNEEDPVSVKKTVFGRNLTYGGKNSRNVSFDSCGKRKKAYDSLESRTVNQVNKTNNNKKSINKSKNVRIYRKK